MRSITLRETSGHLPYTLWWLLAAVSAGLLIARLPLTTTAALIALPAVGLLTLMHPLSAVAFLLIASPLRNLIATESPLNLPLDIGQILVMLSLFAYFIWNVGHNRRLLTTSGLPWLLPLIVFIAATGATVFEALSVSAWLSEWLKWVMIYILALLVLNMGHWQWLLAILALTAAAHAVVGIYIFFGGSGALHLLINDRFFRAFGTFGQPNPFGGFMGLLAPTILFTGLGYGARVLADFQRNRRVNVTSLLIMGYYLSCGGLALAALVMSWSRGAWLGIIVALVTAMVALPRRWYRRLALFILLVAVSGTLWFSGRLPATIVDRIQSATQEIFTFNDVRGVDITPLNYAIVERLAHWQAALNMSRDNWWLGVGFGNYEIAYPQHRLLNWPEPLGHAHNYYLNVLGETGIIGAVSFLALWLWLLFITLRACRHPDLLARMVAVGLIGSWIYLLVHSLTDNLFVNNLFLHLGIMIGIATYLYQQLWRTETIKIK